MVSDSLDQDSESSDIQSEKSAYISMSDNEVDTQYRDPIDSSGTSSSGALRIKS